jgi:uncharacterized membrane protein
MRLTITKYPITKFICIIWSVIAFLFVLFDVNNIIRVVLSIPIILFVPGYLLVSVLFPGKKTEKGLDVVEKIALSFGVSIAIVPLLGIVLNYTPWGIRLEPIILSLGAFIFIVGSIAIVRWYQTPADNRTVLDVRISFPKDETRSDRVLIVILIVCIVIAACLLVYAVFTPRQGERFTEFYILGSNHLASDYPTNLSVGENATIILGVINHEDAFRYYSVEVWLSNQTTSYNTTTQMNETIYHHLWFMDKIDLSLPSLPINLEETTTSQWEYNYTFLINRTGSFKLVFLLYTAQVHQYLKDMDYKAVASEIVDDEHTSAYRNLHLWINVL